jgi:RNA polymerase sigma factor (sigma-70 family)
MSMQSMVESWFRAALSRWPKVRWSLDRFGLHVSGLTPNFPEDVFLGGAASEHLQEAWVAIEADYRAEVVRRVSHRSSRSASPEDLWGEAITRLMAEDPDGPLLPNGARARRIRRFRGESSLPGFIAIIASRHGSDQLRKKLAADRYMAERSATSRMAHSPAEESIMERELAERFASQFRVAFSSLSPLRQALLSLVYGQQLPKAEAGRLLGMRDYKVSRELGAAMDSLRAQLDLAYPGTWSTDALETWTREWTRISGHGGRSTDET